MDKIDRKSLKKLVEVCRKCGIKSLKTSDFEFTLTEEKPVSNYKKSKQKVSKQPVSNNLNVETDSELSPEQLLFYSSIDPLEGIDS